MALHIEPWTAGTCEAGMREFPLAAHLPPCDRGGRWLVNSVLLCGTCKTAIVREDEQKALLGAKKTLP